MFAFLTPSAPSFVAGGRAATRARTNLTRRVAVGAFPESDDPMLGYLLRRVEAGGEDGAQAADMVQQQISKKAAENGMADDPMIEYLLKRVQGGGEDSKQASVMLLQQIANRTKVVEQGTQDDSKITELLKRVQEGGSAGEQASAQVVQLIAAQRGVPESQLDNAPMLKYLLTRAQNGGEDGQQAAAMVLQQVKKEIPVDEEEEKDDDPVVGDLLRRVEAGGSEGAQAAAMLKLQVAEQRKVVDAAATALQQLANQGTNMTDDLMISHLLERVQAGGQDAEQAAEMVVQHVSKQGKAGQVNTGNDLMMAHLVDRIQVGGEEGQRASQMMREHFANQKRAAANKLDTLREKIVMAAQPDDEEEGEKVVEEVEEEEDETPVVREPLTGEFLDEHDDPMMSYLVRRVYAGGEDGHQSASMVLQHIANKCGVTLEEMQAHPMMGYLLRRVQAGGSDGQQAAAMLLQQIAKQSQDQAPEKQLQAGGNINELMKKVQLGGDEGKRASAKVVQQVAMMRGVSEAELENASMLTYLLSRAQAGGKNGEQAAAMVLEQIGKQVGTNKAEPGDDDPVLSGLLKRVAEGGDDGHEAAAEIQELVAEQKRLAGAASMVLQQLASPGMSNDYMVEHLLGRVRSGGDQGREAINMVLQHVAKQSRAEKKHVGEDLMVTHLLGRVNIGGPDGEEATGKIKHHVASQRNLATKEMENLREAMETVVREKDEKDAAAAAAAAEEEEKEDKVANTYSTAPAYAPPARSTPPTQSTSQLYSPPAKSTAPSSSTAPSYSTAPAYAAPAASRTEPEEEEVEVEEVRQPLAGAFLNNSEFPMVSQLLPRVYAGGDDGERAMASVFQQIAKIQGTSEEQVRAHPMLGYMLRRIHSGGDDGQRAAEMLLNQISTKSAAPAAEQAAVPAQEKVQATSLPEGDEVPVEREVLRGAFLDNCKYPMISQLLPRVYAGGADGEAAIAMVIQQIAKAKGVSEAEVKSSSMVSYLLRRVHAGGDDGRQAAEMVVNQVGKTDSPAPAEPSSAPQSSASSSARESLSGHFLDECQFPVISRLLPRVFAGGHDGELAIASVFKEMAKERGVSEAEIKAHPMLGYLLRRVHAGGDDGRQAAEMLVNQIGRNSAAPSGAESSQAREPLSGHFLGECQFPMISRLLPRIYAGGDDGELAIALAFKEVAKERGVSEAEIKAHPMLGYLLRRVYAGGEDGRQAAEMFVDQVGKKSTSTDSNVVEEAVAREPLKGHFLDDCQFPMISQLLPRVYAGGDDGELASAMVLQEIAKQRGDSVEEVKAHPMFGYLLRRVYAGGDDGRQAAEMLVDQVGKKNSAAEDAPTYAPVEAKQPGPRVEKVEVVEEVEEEAVVREPLTGAFLDECQFPMVSQLLPRVYAGGDDGELAMSMVLQEIAKQRGVSEQEIRAQPMLGYLLKRVYGGGADGRQAAEMLISEIEPQPEAKESAGGNPTRSALSGSFLDNCRIPLVSDLLKRIFLGGSDGEVAITMIVQQIAKLRGVPETQVESETMLMYLLQRIKGGGDDGRQAAQLLIESLESVESANAREEVAETFLPQTLLRDSLSICKVELKAIGRVGRSARYEAVAEKVWRLMCRSDWSKVLSKCPECLAVRKDLVEVGIPIEKRRHFLPNLWNWFNSDNFSAFVSYSGETPVIEMPPETEGRVLGLVNEILARKAKSGYARRRDDGVDLSGTVQRVSSIKYN